MGWALRMPPWQGFRVLWHSAGGVTAQTPPTPLHREPINSGQKQGAQLIDAVPGDRRESTGLPCFDYLTSS